MSSLSLSSHRLLIMLAIATIKVSVVFLVASLSAWVLRYRSAALRHAVWTGAFVAAMGIVVLPALLPKWNAVVLPAALPTVAAMGAAPANGAILRDAPVVAPQLSIRETAALSVPASHRAASRPSISLAALLAGIWALGLLAMMGHYGLGRLLLERAMSRGRSNARLDALACRIAERAGISRPIVLRLSAHVQIPLTWGVLRPRIALPADASAWSTGRQRHVLEHELSHVRRLDALTQLIAQAAASIFWFHPLVWYAGAQLRRERELACDDSVMELGERASEYAGDLLAIMVDAGRIERPSVALAFARRSHLEGRVVALLDPATDRRRAPRVAVVTIAISAAALTIPLAALSGAERPMVTVPPPVSANPPSDSPSLRPSPARHVSAAATVTRSTSPHAPATAAPSTSSVANILDGCPSRWNSHNSDEEGNGVNAVWTVSANGGPCTLSLNARGAITFNDETTGLTGISSSGHFEASLTTPRGATSLQITPNGATGLAYDMTVNGVPVASPDSATQWLEAYLTVLDRITAFAVGQRYPVLLAAGGPGRVLDEIDRMLTTHASGEYLARLVNAPALDALDLRRAASALNRVVPGYMVGQMVTALLSRNPSADSSARHAILTAVLAIQPEHDRAVALTAVVSSHPLPETDLLAALRGIGQLATDHDKTEALVAAAHTQRITEQVRTEFESVVAGIRTEYNRRRALQAISR